MVRMLFIDAVHSIFEFTVHNRSTTSNNFKYRYQPERL